VKPIKTLGLAALMALALTALLGTASASASQFRAEEYPVALNGTQITQQKLKTAGSSLFCNPTTMSGSLPAASNTITLTPEFKACSYYGLQATATVNSCKYVFTSTNEAAPFTGTMDIACSNGDKIEFQSPFLGCTVKIPAQSGLNATLANDDILTRSRNRKITATLNATGVKYEDSCFEGTGMHEDGTLTGSTALRGYNNAAAHAVGVYLGSAQVDAPPLFNDEAIGGTIASSPVKTVKLFVDGHTMECANFSLSGSMPAFADQKLDLSVSDWRCSYLGEFAVKANGCSLGLRATTSEGTSVWGLLDVNCPTGKAFTFTNLGCNYSIPAQTNRSQMNYENAGTGTSRTVTAAFGIVGLKYTKECGGTTTFEDGVLTGAVKLAGALSGGSPTGLWMVS
jgi:hypothetical protein